MIPESRRADIRLHGEHPCMAYKPLAAALHAPLASLYLCADELCGEVSNCSTQCLACANFNVISLASALNREPQSHDPGTARISFRKRSPVRTALSHGTACKQRRRLRNPHLKGQVYVALGSFSNSKMKAGRLSRTFEAQPLGRERRRRGKNSPWSVRSG